LVLAVVVVEFFVSDASRGDQGNANEVYAQVLDGKQAEFRGAHDFAGVFGKESEPRSNEVQGQAKEELKVTRDQGGQG
jgi:hypothetical protein